MSAPEGIVSWRGSLLKEGAFFREELWGEALCGKATAVGAFGDAAARNP